MAEETKVYALDDGKNAHETMTKEQIVAAIMQAVNEGTISDIDAGFITKIQEMNRKGELQFWVGTMAEFNALGTKDPDTLYLFTDDPTVEDLEAAIEAVQNGLGAQVSALETSLSDYKDSNDQKVNGIESACQSMAERATGTGPLPEEEGSAIEVTFPTFDAESDTTAKVTFIVRRETDDGIEYATATVLGGDLATGGEYVRLPVFYPSVSHLSTDARPSVRQPVLLVTKSGSRCLSLYLEKNGNGIGSNYRLVLAEADFGYREQEA